MICKVCNSEIKTNDERLLSVGICPTCDFWIEKIFDNQSIRIGGEHYFVGAKLDNYEVDPKDSLQDILERFDSGLKVKGMGGRKTIIRLENGSHVITDDLWHQGTVPGHFKEILHDNARFI